MSKYSDMCPKNMILCRIRQCVVAITEIEIEELMSIRKYCIQIWVIMRIDIPICNTYVNSYRVVYAPRDIYSSLLLFLQIF